MKRIILIICIFLISGCHFNEKQRISKIVEMDLSSCKIKVSWDTHGGFLGDGDYFVKMDCQELNDSSFSSWKKLPLSEELEKVLKMEMCYCDGCHNIYDNMELDKIEKGYYLFIDRHSDSFDKYDETEINNRSSYNFSLAIYNSDLKEMYFYEMDT